MSDSEIIKEQANRFYSAGISAKETSKSWAELYFMVGRIMDSQYLVLKKLEKIEEELNKNNV